MSELSDGDGATGEESTQSGRKHHRGRGARKRRRGKRRNQIRKVPDGNSSAIAGSNISSDESDVAGGSDNGISGPKPKRRRHSVNGRSSGAEAQQVDDVDGRSKQGRDRRNHKFSGGHRSAKNHNSKGVYAALDLGTNNCRLLMAVPRYKGGFRVIDGFSRIVRLGEGLTQTGRLADEAMDRAVEALKVCALKLERRKVRSKRLIATEACRQAENGEEFLQRVRKETGLDLEIVTREAEARLAAEGCGSLMDRKSDAAVMFDIGGGSSELILVNRQGNHRGKVSDHIRAWTSLKMGVVTLAEKFGGKEVSRRKFNEMTDFVFEEISEFEGRNVLKNQFQAGGVHLLGTSGTVTTLAGIHLNLARYDRRKVDGLWLNSSDMDQVIDRLLDMSFEERKQNPCIGPERADLVLAGCAILNAVRKTWPCKRLRVADRGLREGLLTEMMQADRSSAGGHGPGRFNRKANS
ncbi:MAG: Ppx/GppA phosphatase family protein [Pseudomonadota bacterium]